MSDETRRQLELTCPLCGGQEFAGVCKLQPTGGAFIKPRPVELTVAGLEPKDAIRTLSTACLNCGFVITTVDPAALKEKNDLAQKKSDENA